VHFNIFFIYLNINQLDALNFIMSLFHASTCFEHTFSSSGDQNYTIQPLVSSHPTGGRPVHLCTLVNVINLWFCIYLLVVENAESYKRPGIINAVVQKIAICVRYLQLFLFWYFADGATQYFLFILILTNLMH